MHTRTRPFPVSPDDRHHAEILATALDEQGCRDDAKLVRRLAGITQAQSAT